MKQTPSLDFFKFLTYCNYLLIANRFPDAYESSNVRQNVLSAFVVKLLLNVCNRFGLVWLG
jgi:hypothetical protein